MRFALDESQVIPNQCVSHCHLSRTGDHTHVPIVFSCPKLDCRMSGQPHTLLPDHDCQPDGLDATPSQDDSCDSPIILATAAFLTEAVFGHIGDTLQEDDLPPVKRACVTVDISDESDADMEANVDSDDEDPWVQAQTQYGISSHELMILIRNRAPPILFAILMALTSVGVLPIPHELRVNGVEYFAGVAAIQKAIQSIGEKCLAFDKDYDSDGQDLLTNKGFITALVWALRLHQFSLTPWGTLCSSWVWMSRSVTQRSSKDVLGDTSRLCVRQGNLMVSRMCLIWFIVRMRESLYLLEQPSSSMMFDHPRVSERRALGGTTRTWMGCFGAPTAKPTKLGSNDFMLVARLHRRMTTAVRSLLNSDGVTTVEEDVFGHKHVTGGPALKGTQEYTPQFAAAVVRSWQQWRTDKQEASSSDDDADLGQEDDPYLEEIMTARSWTLLHLPRADQDKWSDAEVQRIPEIIRSGEVQAI